MEVVNRGPVVDHDWIRQFAVKFGKYAVWAFSSG